MHQSRAPGVPCKKGSEFFSREFASEKEEIVSSDEILKRHLCTEFTRLVTGLKNIGVHAHSALLAVEMTQEFKALRDLIETAVRRSPRISIVFHWDSLREKFCHELPPPFTNETGKKAGEEFMAEKLGKVVIGRIDRAAKGSGSIILIEKEAKTAIDSRRRLLIAENRDSRSETREVYGDVNR